MEAKQLRKYGSTQLVAKIRKNEFSEEEKVIAIEILKERKADLSSLDVVISTVPQISKDSGTPQEVIDFIDKALEEDNSELCQEIGNILGETDYENLSQDQIDNLLKLRDMPKEKIKKEKPIKIKKERSTIKESFVLNEEQNLIVADESLTKSDKIRKLSGFGLTVKDISISLGIRYAHAFNVLQKSRETEKKIQNLDGIE